MKTEIEKIDMDVLSLSDQVSTLLRGDMVNRFHVTNLLTQEDFMTIQCVLLRLSSTLYGMICAAAHQEKDILTMLNEQAKAAIVEIIKMTDLLAAECVLDLNRVKKNAH